MNKEIIFALAIVVFALYMIKKRKSGFVYSYLLFNILIDVMDGFLDSEQMYTAVARGLVSIYFIIRVAVEKKKLLKGQIIFILFYLYLLILLPFSSAFNTSLASYIKIVITYSMFPIGMALIKDESSFEQLNKTILLMMVVINANFIAANIFKIGRSLYSEYSDFYAGNLKISALNTVTWCLLAMPTILLYSKNRATKRFAKIMIVPTLIFLIVSMKRTSIIALIIGVGIYAIISADRVRLINWVVLMLTIIVIASPLYISSLKEQIDARFGNRLRGENPVAAMEKEARYKESIFVFEEIFQSQNMVKTLFGKQLFNSAGFYADGTFGRRVLHTDYNIILYGSGIVGLIIFLCIYLHIYREFAQLRPKRSAGSVSKKVYKILKPQFYAVFLAGIAVSVTGGLLAITHRSLMFLYLGALIGRLKSGA